PFAPADRLGQIARPGRRRGLGEQGAWFSGVVIAGLAEKARIRLNRTNKENRAAFPPHRGSSKGNTMAAAKVNVIELIDRHPVTPFQIGVLILCMLVAALDGFDTQAIGYTAPAIAAVIHLPMPQFGQVGSAGLVGAALGALSFGPLADVFGRKW